jgi:hypothetical membrane protein
MIWEWFVFALAFIVPFIGILIYSYRIRKGKSKKPEPGSSWLDSMDNWF